MNKNLLGILASTGQGVSIEDMLPAIAETGFDAFFTPWWNNAPVREFKKIGNSLGLIYQSVHAPFNTVNTVWEEGESGEKEIDMLISCMHDCAENDISIMVTHPIIGMNRHSPNMLGIDRFARLIRESEKEGVKIAFENVEGLEYLKLIIKELYDSPAIGFCWDTGHEQCYNFSEDVPLLYGNKLICTHLNDNIGMTDPEKKNVTWLDDLHLVPFDGTVDWQSVADRLDRVNYSEVLTFELQTLNKPGRHYSDIYNDMDHFAFLALAFKRAKKVASMRKGE